MTNLMSSFEDAGSMAAGVLSGWISLPKSGLRRELSRIEELARRVAPPSTLEMERIDVLLGAIECLQSERSERARAALSVLEHLAKKSESTVISCWLTPEQECRRTPQRVN
jgi:hypothetical protein